MTVGGSNQRKFELVASVRHTRRARTPSPPSLCFGATGRSGHPNWAQNFLPPLRVNLMCYMLQGNSECLREPVFAMVFCAFWVLHKVLRSRYREMLRRVGAALVRGVRRGAREKCLSCRSL